MTIELFTELLFKGSVIVFMITTFLQFRRYNKAFRLQKITNTLMDQLLIKILIGKSIGEVSNKGIKFHIKKPKKSSKKVVR